MNTLFDKIWDAHVIQNVEDGPTQLYIDRLYAHEVTSPQAFDTLRDKGIKVFTLKVSPILGAYLSRGLINSYLGKWKRKYKCKISLVEDNDFSVLQNEFYNEKGDKLDS